MSTVVAVGYLVKCVTAVRPGRVKTLDEARHTPIALGSWRSVNRAAAANSDARTFERQKNRRFAFSHNPYGHRPTLEQPARVWWSAHPDHAARNDTLYRSATNTGRIPGQYVLALNSSITNSPSTANVRMVSSPEEFVAFMSAENGKWAKVIKDGGLEQVDLAHRS